MRAYPRRSSKCSNPWSQGSRDDGLSSPLFRLKHTDGERPVIKCGRLVNWLTTSWHRRLFALLSIHRLHMYTAGRTRDVCPFASTRSVVDGSPAGLGADEHHLRGLGRRREAVFAPELRAPPRQSHPQRGHGMQCMQRPGVCRLRSPWPFGGHTGHQEPEIPETAPSQIR
jgi:hypothetical protein